MLQVSFTERQIDHRRRGQADIYLHLCLLLLVTLSRVGPTQADSLFEASGERALSSTLLQGNGRVRYLLWPVVSLETLLSAWSQSGLSATVDYICNPSCLPLQPCCRLRSPAAGVQSVEKLLHNGSP